MYEVKRRERRVINWIRKWIYEFMHMEWREFDGWEDKLSRVKRRCFPSSPLRHKSRDPPRRPSCSRRSARASPADWTCTAPPPAGTEEGEWSMVWAGSWRTSAGVYLIFRPERLEQWSSPQETSDGRSLTTAGRAGWWFVPPGISWSCVIEVHELLEDWISSACVLSDQDMKRTAESLILNLI